MLKNKSNDKEANKKDSKQAAIADAVARAQAKKAERQKDNSER